MQRRDPKLHLRLAVAALAIVAALGIGGKLRAQNTGPIPAAGAGTYGPPVASRNGHTAFGNGAPPAINAACGTNPQGPFGTDTAFHFVSGTSTSAACTITPAVSYPDRPTCSVDSEAGSVAYQVAANGNITLSGVADSTRYHVTCFAQPGKL